MAQWEYYAVHLSAATLKKPDESPTVHELAGRLSEAIIDAVDLQKTERWELLKMDFNAGEVTIRFRRAVISAR